MCFLDCGRRWQSHDDGAPPAIRRWVACTTLAAAPAGLHESTAQRHAGLRQAESDALGKVVVDAIRMFVTLVQLAPVRVFNGLADAGQLDRATNSLPRL